MFYVKKEFLKEDNTMKNKNVFITGANGGIGRALVATFAAKKANIWACVLTPDSKFDVFCTKLAQENDVTIETIVCDITNYATVKKIVLDIRKTGRSIDVLVNNAGILKEALLQMTSMDMARQMFEVNFFAPLYLSQMFSKIMIQRKSGGAIINISSIAALDGVEGQTVYGATKAALYSMTKSMAKELGKYNIRANCVAPGVTQTPLIVNMRQDVFEQEKSTSYLKRLGQPQDIADAVAFLASNEAKYITGQILRVDGGRN